MSPLNLDTKNLWHNDFQDVSDYKFTMREARPRMTWAVVSE